MGRLFPDQGKVKDVAVAVGQKVAGDGDGTGIPGVGIAEGQATLGRCLVAGELVGQYLVVLRLHDGVAVYDEISGEAGGLDVDPLYASCHFFHVVDDYACSCSECGGECGIFSCYGAGELCPAVVVCRIDGHGSRNRGVVQDDGSAVLTHGIFFPDDEACGVGALAAGDELPELCGLDLSLDSQGAASVAGEADAFGVSLAAVGEYGFAGELCGGHVCEVQVEEGLLCGVVHKDQVADLSVCHVVVGHSSSSSLFFVYKKDPWNTGLNDGGIPSILHRL